MPRATFERYRTILDHARSEGHALPAINVLEIDTLNAAIEGFAAAQSDGIVQVTPGAGYHTSGNVQDPALGAITLAEHAHRVAERYDVNVAIHSDHCPARLLDVFLRPLIAETARRREAGLPNLFDSHMFDGSDLPLGENMRLAAELLCACRDNDIILEVECGVLGGGEEGAQGGNGSVDQKLYTTPADMIAVHEALSAVDGAEYMLAPAFGNAHGVYKPGEVVLQPRILKQCQDAVAERFGEQARFRLVFHGGSGSSIEDIHEAIGYGVVKMNVHTDTQYAFTRAVADHMFRNYDGVMRVDGEVGRKTDYLTSTWLEKGRAGMVGRVVQVCEELRSAGRSLGTE